MAQLRSGLGILLTSTFLLIGILLLSTIIAENAEASETHRLNGEVTWSGKVVFADSILVTEGSTLLVEDSLIIMNNSAPFPEISIHGTLRMNGSQIIPLDHTSENRFTFKVYGSCRLVGSEFIRPNSLSFFTNDVYLSGNLIKESKADAIFINGVKGSNLTSRINYNTIVDSDLNGIRLIEANADLLDNEITSSKFDAVHLSATQASITSGVYTDSKRYPIYITGNSTLDVFDGANLTDDSYVFGDDHSTVRVHEIDGIKVLQNDSDDEVDYLMIAVFVSILALASLVGVHLFYQWNRDRSTSGKYALPSL